MEKILEPGFILGCIFQNAYRMNFSEIHLVMEGAKEIYERRHPDTEIIFPDNQEFTDALKKFASPSNGDGAENSFDVRKYDDDWEPAVMRGTKFQTWCDAHSKERWHGDDELAEIIKDIVKGRRLA